MKKFNSLSSKFFKKSIRVFRGLIMVLGWFTLAGILLALTDIPYFAYYRLGTVNAEVDRKPDYIIMLGSMGIPSPDDLMRVYYTAGAWKEAEQAKVIVAFPADTSLHEDSPELLMAGELKMRGVDSTMILFECFGYSTRTQALNILGMLGKENAANLTLRIITSPEHMYRAIRTFRKVGFYQAGGTPTFEKVIAEEKLMKGVNRRKEKTGLTLRYRIWSYMVYEIIVVREFMAIVYYKVRGWI
jgi:uncharacterized SAM-binding protein YcdF (DUF218 family)